MGFSTPLESRTPSPVPQPLLGLFLDVPLTRLQATITEALWFSGRIRLPEELSDEAVRKFVAEVRA